MHAFFASFHETKAVGNTIIHNHNKLDRWQSWHIKKRRRKWGGTLQSVIISKQGVAKSQNDRNPVTCTVRSTWTAYCYPCFIITLTMLYLSRIVSGGSTEYITFAKLGEFSISGLFPTIVLVRRYWKSGYVYTRKCQSKEFNPIVIFKMSKF